MENQTNNLRQNQPSIVLEKQGRTYTGMGYGLRCPILVVQLGISVKSVEVIAKAQKLISRVIDSDAVKLTINDTNDCAQYLTQLMLDITQRAKLPIFEASKFHYLGADKHHHHYRLAIPYVDVNSSVSILKSVVSMLNYSEPSAEASSEQLQSQYDQLRSTLRRWEVKGHNSYYFLKAAYDLKIPTTQIGQTTYSYGLGSKSELLNSSFTEDTSVIGAQIARNKLSCSRALQHAGLPATIAVSITSEDDAVTAANKLGYPVVIKPTDRDGGVGVQAFLKSETQVRKAWPRARSVSHNILLERHCEGLDYRFTVFRDQIIKTVVRVPASVSGDGINTINNLIDQFNNDKEQKRRAWEHGDKVLLSLNEEAMELLQEQSLAPDSIPTSGQKVQLKRSANVSAGGTPTLYDGTIHPDNADMVIRAAQALKLELAGVDVIMPDISTSWLESPAAILEVNAQPQIGAGSTPDIYHHILRDMFPQGASPALFLFIGEPEQSNCFELLQTELLNLQASATQPFNIGWSSLQGVFINQKQRTLKPGDGFEAASLLTSQRDLDFGLCCLTPSELLGRGLPLSNFDALVVDPSISLNEHQQQELITLVGEHCDQCQIENNEKISEDEKIKEAMGILKKVFSNFYQSSSH